MKITAKDKIFFNKKAAEMRRLVISMVTKAKDGHIPSAFSLVEILLVLCYKILKIDPLNPNKLDRDRLILSKGHGCASLYTVLMDKGFFPREELDKYATTEGILGGHPEMQKVPGIEVSTGSLGQGSPMGVGMALSANLSKDDRKIYCIVGDGECNEGSIWEAAASAAHFNLDNLVVILDYNKQQASGRVEDVLNPGDLPKKWEAFGWSVQEIDGHNLDQIYTVLSKVPFKKNKPSAIIANTIKGKGISFMEDDKKWHTGIPNDEEYNAAMSELNLIKKLIK